MEKEYQKNKVDSLKKELANCMESIEDEFSVEKIDEICAELSRLESESHIFDMNKRKEEFFTDYLPLLQDKEELEIEPKENRRIRFSRRLRQVVILAAVIVGLFGVTSIASGKNFFEAILNWNNEQLYVAVEEDYNLELGLQDVYIPWSDIEGELPISVPKIGFFNDKMYVTSYDNITNEMIDIVLTDGVNDYVYSIQSLEHGNLKLIIEKSDKEPAEYIVNNTTYYFVYNKNWISIAWQHNNDLHTIIGVLNDTDAVAIVESISYK